MPLTDPFFYAVAIPAFLLVGISKGGFGGALGSMGVPLMALAIPVPQAAAIMLPLLMVMDVFAIRRYWPDRARAHMRILMAGAVLGTALGYLAFKFLDELWIRLLIGLIAVIFSARDLLRDYRGHAIAAPAAPDPLKGVFWSSVSGVTSFIANAGGPPLQVYLLPYRMDKTAFVATVSVFFWVVNWLKFFPFLQLGLFTFDNVGTSVLLLPVAAIGMWLGFRLHDRVDQKRFYLLCNFFLLATGAKLVHDGIAGLFFR